MSDGEIKQRHYPRGAMLWIPSVIFIVMGALALWKVPEWLLQHWIPADDPEEQRKLLGSAAQIVLLALGGIIAVIGVALSIARHGQDLVTSDRSQQELDFEKAKEAARRAEFTTQRSLDEGREQSRIAELESARRAEEERALRARFVTSVELLSSDAPIQRTAGLYALAALGDDWTTFGRRDELQVCVDVICGYLRSADIDASAKASEADVRRVGYDLIRSNLRPDDERGDVPWAGLAINLRAAPIWFDVDLTYLMCEGRTLIVMADCVVSDGATLNLRNSRIGKASIMALAGALITDGATLELDNSIIRDGGELDAGGIRLSGGGTMRLDQSVVKSRGVLSLARLRLDEDSAASANGLTVESNANVRAQNVVMRKGSTLSIQSTQIQSDGQVWLDHAKLVANAVLDLSGSSVNGGVLGLTGISLGKDSVLRLDNTDLISPRSVSLDGLQLHDGGQVTASHATIDDQVLTLPNGRSLKTDGTRQPGGTIIATDHITTSRTAILFPELLDDDATAPEG